MHWPPIGPPQPQWRWPFKNIRATQVCGPFRRNRQRKQKRRTP